MSIALLALLLRLVAFHGLVGGDDAAYVGDASALAHGRFVPAATQWDVRIGVIGPTAAAIRFFGLHPWSVALYPLLLSLLSLALIYHLGKALYNVRVGLLAALLLACFPEDIYYSTVVYPDLPGAFYGALAVWCAYRSRVARTPIARRRMAVACGLSIAASYLSWEADLIFVPVCLVMLWGRHRPKTVARTLLALSIPLVVIALEALAYWRIDGDPFFRFAALRHHTGDLEVTTWRYFALRWVDTLFIPIHPAFSPRTFFYALLTLWAVLMAWRRGLCPSDRFLLCWLLGIFVVFAFAVTSVRPLTPLLQPVPRYMQGVFFPAILLAASALCALFERPAGARGSG